MKGTGVCNNRNNIQITSTNDNVIHNGIINMDNNDTYFKKDYNDLLELAKKSNIKGLKYLKENNIQYANKNNYFISHLRKDGYWGIRVLSVHNNEVIIILQAVISQHKYNNYSKRLKDLVDLINYFETENFKFVNKENKLKYLKKEKFELYIKHNGNFNKQLRTILRDLRKFKAHYQNLK